MSIPQSTTGKQAPKTREDYMETAVRLVDHNPPDMGEGSTITDYELCCLTNAVRALVCATLAQSAPESHITEDNHAAGLLVALVSELQSIYDVAIPSDVQLRFPDLYEVFQHAEAFVERGSERLTAAILDPMKAELAEGERAAT